MKLFSMYKKVERENKIKVTQVRCTTCPRENFIVHKDVFVHIGPLPEGVPEGKLLIASSIEEAIEKLSSHCENITVIGETETEVKWEEVDKTSISEAVEDGARWNKEKNTLSVRFGNMLLIFPPGKYGFWYKYEKIQGDFICRPGKMPLFFIKEGHGTHELRIEQCSPRRGWFITPEELLEQLREDGAVHLTVQRRLLGVVYKNK